MWPSNPEFEQISCGITLMSVRLGVSYRLSVIGYKYWLVVSG